MINQVSAQDILTIVTSIVTISSIFVKITPNKIDNKIIDTIMDIINIISINNRGRAD